MSDTIFALATAPGRAAIAVVRLSGPGSAEALRGLAGDLPAPRRASVRRLSDPDSGVALDDALVLWFPAPGSYTGEDSAELHLHGGVSVVEAVAAALLQLGLRLADPGEFTRRAFEHGRLDLSQAEAVADLVDAETLGQREQALRQLGGELARRYEGWRKGLVEALAYLEAAVDFPDEELPADLAERVRPKVMALSAEMQQALGDAARGERVRDGFKVALIGAPNAGKSSLLNSLLGRDAAIVTPMPGTTRDVIEAPVVIAGFKVLFADTAGLREASDEVEIEGVRRARAWAEQADLRLCVVDRSLSSGAWEEALAHAQAGDLLVLNKADLPEGSDGGAARKAAEAAGLASCESVARGPDGADAVTAAISVEVVTRLSGSEFPASTRLRHRERLIEALQHLGRAEQSLSVGAELAAEDLRLAARAVGRIAGRVDAEAVLDVVFGSFCIGK
jgi:tRNA modification GTPase